MMGKADAARRTAGEEDLYDRIGAFLVDHRLGHDPATYALVHAVLSRPDDMLAREVGRLIDGGVRLAREDVERLGGRSAGATPPPRAPRTKTPPAEREVMEGAARLVAETQAQVDGFADIMAAMRHETQDFGRDLAASAAALGAADARASVDLLHIAAAMVASARASETRLAKATVDADALRARLADAQATARRDPLTGMPNRLAFAEAFAGLSDRPGPHCLALCDIDRFKRINDEHGHGVGDRVLTAIGQELGAACAGHLVARHGGEEFVVLLSGMTLVTAAARLDAARERIAAKRFRNRDTDTGLGEITFSAGVVAIRPGEGAEDATDRADLLMYAAKDQGRDRICVA